MAAIVIFEPRRMRRPSAAFVAFGCLVKDLRELKLPFLLLWKLTRSVALKCCANEPFEVR